MLNFYVLGFRLNHIENNARLLFVAIWSEILLKEKPRKYKTLAKRIEWKEKYIEKCLKEGTIPFKHYRIGPWEQRIALLFFGNFDEILKRIISFLIF
jgi:hypothetical protein